MKKILLTCFLVAIFLTIACSRNAGSQRNNSANVQEIKTIEKQNDVLQKQIAQIASAAEGRVGVKAVVLETGEFASVNEREHFPMQSVYKLPIGMAVLKQIDGGKIKLEERVRVEKSDFVRKGMHSPIRDNNPNGTELTVRELLRFAVSESDGTASDVLLRLAGDSDAVGKYLNDIKISDIVVADSEKEIGKDWQTQYRNWASPEGATALLRALHEGQALSEESRTLLLKFMIDSPTGLKRLKRFLPTETIVAHKTGTSGTQKGITAATNDIGLITLPNGRHLAVAVFVSDSAASEEAREEVIAKIAKAVWDNWSK
jgi:beta-lactamase class A